MGVEKAAQHTVDERVLKARLAILMSQPYLSTAVLGLKIMPLETESISTFATDGTKIVYNRAFADSLKFEELQGVLLHELMHVLLEHAQRRGERKPKLWNCACDYAVNDILYRLGITLPSEALYEEAYRGLTAEEIYELLLSRDSDGRISSQCTDLPLPGDLLDGLPDWVETLAAGIPGVGREQLRGMFKGLRQSLIDALKNRGTLTGDFAEKILVLDSAVLNWRELLAMHMLERARVTWQMWPPAKKYLSQGLCLPSVGGLVPVPVVLAVDTSGSMDSRLLGAIYGEIQRLKEQLGCELTIVQADVRVAAVTHYDALEEMPDGSDVTVHGRGGSSTVEVFEWVKMQERAQMPLLIFVTDGYTEYPKVPPEYPVIWLVTNRLSASNTPPWGLVLPVSL